MLDNDERYENEITCLGLHVLHTNVHTLLHCYSKQEEYMLNVGYSSVGQK